MSAVQLMNIVKQHTCRMYSAEDKLRVVLAGLRGELTVAEIA